VVTTSEVSAASSGGGGGIAAGPTPGDLLVQAVLFGHSPTEYYFRKNGSDDRPMRALDLIGSAELSTAAQRSDSAATAQAQPAVARPVVGLFSSECGSCGHYLR
jgi:hypothetical protein